MSTSVKIPHLVLALAFLGTSLGWLLVVLGVLDAAQLRYAAPGVLIGAGALGLLAAALNQRRAQHRDQHRDQD